MAYNKEKYIIKRINKKPSYSYNYIAKFSMFNFIIFLLLAIGLYILNFHWSIIVFTIFTGVIRSFAYEEDIK